MEKTPPPARSFGKTYKSNASIQQERQNWQLYNKTPAPFVRSPNRQRYRAERVFKPGSSGYIMERGLGPDAYLFGPRFREIGLPDSFENPKNLIDAAAMDTIFTALAEYFRGLVYAVLEVGKDGRLHPHVLAHRLDGPGPDRLRRGTERCKPVEAEKGGAKAWYAYVGKEQPWTLEAELDYKAARVLSPTGKLPKRRRHFVGRQRLQMAFLFDLMSISEKPDLKLTQ